MAPITKDAAEMTGPELVAAYNKLVPADKHVKKFKDRATGLKRLAEATTAKKTTTPAPQATKAKATQAPKSGQVKVPSDNKLAAEFDARVGSNREKLLIALDENFNKMVKFTTLLKPVYGSVNLDNLGALGMVLKGAKATIENKKLSYIIKEEGKKAEEKMVGLFAAK